MTGRNNLEDVPQPFFSLLGKARTSRCRAHAHLDGGYGDYGYSMPCVNGSICSAKKKQFSCLLNFLSQG